MYDFLHLKHESYMISQVPYKDRTRKCVPVSKPQSPSGLIQKKISQVPNPDSESDVKYKAAKRTLQSRSLRFLLTEKNQDLGVSAKGNTKFGSLCQEKVQVLGHSVKSTTKTCDLLAGKTQDLQFLLAEKILELSFSGQG